MKSLERQKKNCIEIKSQTIDNKAHKILFLVKHSLPVKTCYSHKAKQKSFSKN